MLSLEEIIREYPRELQPYKKFLFKEYLQYKILGIIFKERLGKKISFLGGTALRIIHGNRRFSEDLDFDNFGLKEGEFNELIQRVKKSLENEGYLVETRNVHKGAYRCYVKFPELLYEAGLSTIRGEKILIQIDTMAHKFKYTPDTILLNKFDVFREIKVTPPDIILSQKIFSAFNRKRSKGRDFYDIVFLLARVEPNYKYLKLKLDITNANQLKEALLKRCQKFDFKELARDVKPFIFEKNGVEKVLKFKKAIESIRSPDRAYFYTKEW